MVTTAWVASQFPELSAITEYPHGGQKWVFGATHPGDGAVVIKLIKPGTNADRVQREILAVTQVRSPRVPTIFEQGLLKAVAGVGDVVWIREQRVDGENVRQVLERGPLGPAEVLRLGQGVLEALTDVAQARIVHRDVKPENIMRATNGTYWLLDFGIARHLELTSLTATAALGGPGTLGYAPPEQFRNQKRELDERADLFALAVTLVESLTGTHPYREGARDRPEVLRRIEQAPLPVPAIAWDATGKLFDLINAMGQRRKDCRPRGAAEALAWIKEIPMPAGA